MRFPVSVLGYAAALVLLACQSAPAAPTPTPGPVSTATPTRTPEPRFPLGTCAFTDHPDAQNRDGTPPTASDKVIKATTNEAGLKIYYVPGMRRYQAIRVDESAGGRWFCTESEAERAGWRAAASPRQ